MKLLIGLLFVSVVLLLLVIGAYELWSFFKHSYTEVFNSENLPSVEETALRELMEDEL